MSYCFRDLESAGNDKRKSAILLALVASLDDLRAPNPNETRKFSELFVPLFNAVPRDIQRRAATSLSRCPFVPANVCEFISLQPTEISAPFLSHSPSLTNPILCYVIAKTDISYAKIIARRKDLNKRVIQSLLALDEPSVNRALQLRGYVGDASIHLNAQEIRRDISAKVTPDTLGAKPSHGDVELFIDNNNSDQHIGNFQSGEWHELWPGEELRKPEDMQTKAPVKTPITTVDAPLENAWMDVTSDEPYHVSMKSVERVLAGNRGQDSGAVDMFDTPNNLAEGTIVAKVGVTKSTDAAPRLKVTYVDRKNTQSDNNEGGVSNEQFAAEEHLRQTLRELASGDLTPQEAIAAEEHYRKREEELQPIELPILAGEIAHRRHIAMMEKHMRNNQLEYFTTCLADAIGSTIDLSDRIMSDMSGRQLAITFSAILAPQELCVEALNKFFPHVSLMEGTEQGAEELLNEQPHGKSLKRLLTWVKADMLTREDALNRLGEVEFTDADVDYSKIEIGDLPYVTPVADNVDQAPRELPDSSVSSFDDGDWLKAISD